MESIGAQSISTAGAACSLSDAVELSACAAHPYISAVAARIIAFRMDTPLLLLSIE
jgi:hypothetical protein